MAFVLALVILGWLVAFALAAQVGFENEPDTVKVSSPASGPVQSQRANYRDPMSAAQLVEHRCADGTAVINLDDSDDED